MQFSKGRSEVSERMGFDHQFVAKQVLLKINESMDR